VSLRGGKEQQNELERLVKFDFSKLKCTFESFSDAEKCATSVNGQGDLCSFCSMKDEDSGEEVGICVDPDLAPNMQQMNPKISCTNVDDKVATKEVETQLQDYHDFKCSIKGLNDAEKCSHMHTQDGKKHCEYCSMNGPLGEKGICVSPEHARKLKQIAPTMHCSRGSYNQKTQEDMPTSSFTSSFSEWKNPISDCNLSGTDIETCLDPSKVNGSKCIWCDAAIGGFCFPESWSKTAGRFLKCQDKPSGDDDTTTSTTTVITAPAKSSYDSNCYKIGFKQDEGVEDCRNAIDESTGDYCVFCKAPALGGVGLCMPPDWRGHSGEFYECDGGKLELGAVQSS